MNNAIIPLLHTLLKEQSALHGKALLSDLTLLRNLLADYAPQYRAERNLLLRAVEENIPAEIIAQSKNGDTIDPLLIGRWVKHLESNHGMSPENARWTVRVWSKAMGRKMAENNAPPPPVLPTNDSPLMPSPLPRLHSEQNRLLAIMLDISRPPEERAEAGRKINQVPGGDPRPGVLDFNWDEGYWCRVPKGEFIYQGKPHKIDEDFWIAQYPITWAQWKLFLETKDGYRNPDWWKNLHKDGVKQQKGGAGKQRFEFDNHPVENVSWYDVVAFCRWLDAAWEAGRIKLPMIVPSWYVLRLPLETEWEKAASWDAKEIKACDYPWGDDYQVGFANINEIFPYDKVGPHYLEATTAVGIYPQGQAVCGALDMSGNVWEWCLNEYGNLSVNTSTAKNRCLRGGSWGLSRNLARAANRDSRISLDRNSHEGFRMVIGSITPLSKI